MNNTQQNYEVVEHIKLKNNVLKHSVFFSVVSTIVDQVNNQIPNISVLKLDVELTELICNAVLNLLTPKQEKMFDVVELYVAVILKLFELNEDEVMQVRGQIEYLQVNKKIKRISSTKKLWKYFSSWLLRRLG